MVIENYIFVKSETLIEIDIKHKILFLSDDINCKY